MAQESAFHRGAGEDKVNRKLLILAFILGHRSLVQQIARDVCFKIRTLSANKIYLSLFLECVLIYFRPSNMFALLSLHTAGYSFAFSTKSTGVDYDVPGACHNTPQHPNA